MHSNEKPIARRVTRVLVMKVSFEIYGEHLFNGKKRGTNYAPPLKIGRNIFVFYGLMLTPHFTLFDMIPTLGNRALPNRQCSIASPGLVI